jgi:hypothetical protein
MVNINKNTGNPGPGSYSAKTLNLTQSSPSFVFGSQSKSTSIVKLNPGPGTYTHKDLIGNEGPSKSMTAKRPLTARSDSPGPAQYNVRNCEPNNRVSTPNYTFGTSKRDNIKS